MKALVKSKAERGLWLEDIPEPEIGINDVLIRVRYTGICGTDVHIYEWDDWAQNTIHVPLTIGHEFVGKIVAVGSNVSDFYPGDIVSGEGHVVCGRCRNCLAGRRHLCASAKGVGVNRPGAFAELISLPMTNIWRHNPGIDQEVAAIFDPFRQRRAYRAFVSSAGRRCADHRRRPHRHHGHSCGAACRRAACCHHRPESIPAGAGAQNGRNPGGESERDSAREVQKQLGMAEGFDVGLEMSGNPQALRDMIANMSHGGKIAVLGIPAKEVVIELRQIIFSMLTLKGIYGREMYETWYKMTVMLESGLDISPVITHRFSYKDYEKGFDAMISGQAGKVVLDWTSLG